MCLRIFVGFFGPIWTRPGPVGGRNPQGKHICLHCFPFIKNRNFACNYSIFYSFNVFFRFLAEVRFRTSMKLPQEASFGITTCSFELPRRTEEVRIAVQTSSCRFEPPAAGSNLQSALTLVSGSDLSSWSRIRLPVESLSTGPTFQRLKFRIYHTFKDSLIFQRYSLHINVFAFKISQNKQNNFP